MLQSVVALLTQILNLKKKNKSKAYYIDYARQMARKYYVNEQVFCAVIEAESSWNPNAKLVNKNGTTDWGICQFNDY
jgi:soluble lytic murein transglycosylase-like protein